MKKGDIFEGKIIRVDFPNKCRVETADGQVIQVKNGIPGQTVRGIVQKKRGGRLTGRILEVVEASPLETSAPLCSMFPACGGCTYQTMAYESQLEMKKTQVKQLLDEALRAAGQLDGRGKPDYIFEGIMASPEKLAYRNKMEFSFGDEYKGGPLTLGLHKKGSTYDILSAGDCKIVHKDFCAVLNCVQDYFRENPVPVYRKMQHTGCLRHLLVRRSISSGEILSALVTTSQETLNLDELKERLLGLPLEGHLSGILHIINDSLADVVQSDHTEILYGREDFYEELLGLKFRITPFSFFQTNTKGAEVLYETAREFIGDTRDRVIYDLYSGTGTIAQILAPLAARVVGVEIVPEAVEAARENAALNGLANCQFLAGDVLKMLDEIEETPDLIVLDPPRDGVNPRALKKIIGYGVEKMVYISCKPTSLARDLEMIIGGGYRVERVQCVDMFPFAAHVETVVQLVNIGVKPDYTVRLEVDVDEFYKTVGEEKRHFVKPDQKNKKDK